MKSFFVVLFIIIFGSVSAEEIIPTKEQTSQLKGTTSIKDGIRTQTGEVDDTGHGPFTIYNVPFEEGTISFSWKVEKEQKVVLVVDGKKNGKATHNLKVIPHSTNACAYCERSWHFG